MSSSSAPDQSKALPPAEAFYLDTPLYEFYPYTASDYSALKRLFYFDGALDAYCVACEDESIFHRTFPVVHISQVTSEHVLGGAFRDLKFTCSRSVHHELWFRFLQTNEEVGKVGQFPSLADLHLPQLAKYRDLLRKEDYRELARAVGLAAHGIGIGSFVYLRRVFERLIYEARQSASGLTITEADFDKLRMDEKVLLLRDDLPPFLVEHRALYVILSTGIHALTEEECLRHFDAVRLGIEMILDQKLTAEAQRAKLKEATEALQRVRGQLRS